MPKKKFGYGVRFQHVFLSNPLENGTVSVTCQYKLYRWHSEVTSVAEYFSMSSHLYISLLKHCIEKKNSWVCCNFLAGESVKWVNRKSGNVGQQRVLSMQDSEAHCTPSWNGAKRTEQRFLYFGIVLFMNTYLV